MDIRDRSLYPKKQSRFGAQRWMTIGTDFANLSSIPINDQNAWYYPSQGHDDSDEDPLDVSTSRGNWGKKTTRGSRWVRKGKIAAWGPGMDEWEVWQSICSSRIFKITSD